MLVKHNPDAAPPSTELLSTIFKEWEGIRIPRTAALVKGARQTGEGRVVDGVQACLARNQTVRDIWADDEKLLDASEYLLGAPFKGKGEI